jgi:hypothetical protein
MTAHAKYSNEPFFSFNGVTFPETKIHKNRLDVVMHRNRERKIMSLRLVRGKSSETLL